VRTFIIVWLGQLVSTFGSKMTGFALGIWAWEITGEATTLALVSVSTQIPRLLILPFAGMIVDRWNRKLLLIVGDTITVLSTVAILLLYVSGNLQIWHLYAIGIVNGAFNQLQGLAYSASITLMVPRQQYTRASSMGSVLHYGSIIIAPALAGALYYVIGLLGILLIDIATFAIAISTVLFVHIPQPPLPEQTSQDPKNIWQELQFGFRYIFASPGLWALLIAESLFVFAHDFGGALFRPMILARTGNDARVLGTISSAAGIGGVVGAVIVTTWGGPKRRIQGFLLGMVGAGISKTIFGLARTPLIWLPAQFCSSLNFPLKSSCSDAIWRLKVEPNLQGRVFASRRMFALALSPIAKLIAAPLADYVVEPAMMPGGTLAPLLGRIFGTNPGAGMAFLYVMSSICLVLIGLGGYAFPSLREVEDSVPSGGATTA
jgi:MFS family permease